MEILINVLGFLAALAFILVFVGAIVFGVRKGNTDTQTPESQQDASSTDSQDSEDQTPTQ